MDDAKVNQWIRLYVNADNELWLTVINSKYVLQADDKVSTQHYQLRAGAQIFLPHNQFTISDHPFLCDPDEAVIKVTASEELIKTKTSEDSHCASQLAKNKLLADIDHIFPDSKLGDIQPAQQAIQAEPEQDHLRTNEFDLDIRADDFQRWESKQNRAFFGLRSIGIITIGIGAVLLKWYAGY